MPSYGLGYTIVLPFGIPHHKCLINQLEMEQWRTARYVLGIYDPYASVTDMLVTLKWQTLAQRREHQCLILLYKIVNDLVAVEKARYLSPNTGKSRHFNSMSFQIPHSSSDIHKFSFFPRTVPVWNALPDTVVSSVSVEGFKTSLSNHTSL